MSKTENNSNKKPISRRDFLTLVWKGLGVIALIEVVVIIGSYFFSNKKKEKNNSVRLFEAGTVNDFKNNTVSAFMGGHFYLVRLQDGGFMALSIRCTHLGCSISWEDAKNQFICPCHSSAFDIAGEVLNPPATKPLNYYPVLIEKGIVKVDISNLKDRNSVRKEQLIYA
jgi:cytochrome b6-f complex iron-sulfur subunit